MTTDDQIRDQKLQYDINREAAKILSLVSGKIHKYEYLTGEDILLSNKQQIIEQAKFIYSPLEKALEKQIKTIEDQGEKKQKQFLIRDELRELKNIILMMKIVHRFLDKNKYFMNLQIKGLMK